MKVRTYLCAKYSVQSPTTLTGKEAALFAIPYPPEHGWAKTYGDIEITPEMAASLAVILKWQSTSAKNIKARMAKSGLAALEAAYSLPLGPSSNAAVASVSAKLKRKRKRDNKKRHAREADRVQPRQDHPRPKTNFVITDAFLLSYEWRRVRMEAIKKYGRHCQCCGATPADGITQINVDHIKPRRIYPELALDVRNLQVLCNVCNHGKGNWDMTDWRETEITDAANISHIASLLKEEE